jgi:hypothetical protein
MAKTKIKKKAPSKKQVVATVKKIAAIKWIPKEVLINEIAYTPKNYKIKTDLGSERLDTTLGKFGLAGTTIVNPFSLADMKKLGVPDMKGKKYVLIDGNSRVLKATENGDKKIWVSIPNKPLNIKDFTEFSAMFDFAKAGEVDIDRILGDLGKTEQFYHAYGLEPDMVKKVEQMGNKASIAKELEYPEEGNGASSKAKKNGKAPEVSDVRLVQLFFTEKQEAEFRKWEDKALKKFKVSNTTDFVYAALKSLKL